MTSIDLDFQDYKPNNSRIQQQPEQLQVKIPSPVRLKQNVLNTGQYSQSSGGMSDEAIQQIMWLSGLQSNKRQQQRNVASSKSNWGLSYLAQYFDVTTRDVLQRILWSAVPIRKFDYNLDEPELTAPLAYDAHSSSKFIDSDTFSPTSSPSSPSDGLYDKFNGRKKHSYMERFIQSRPDFYGPFWISTTLIFAVAIFSNIVSFINFKTRMNQINMIQGGLSGKDNTKNNDSSILDLNMQQLIDQSEESWHYSMDELNTVSSVVMFYATLLPTFIWFLFWFRGCAKYYTLSETICAYGYSLSIFIPLSALLMVQVTLFRYAVLMLASLMSGIALTVSFLPVVHSDPNAAGSRFILILVMTFQFGLAYTLHRIMLI